MVSKKLLQNIFDNFEKKFTNKVGDSFILGLA